MRNAILILTLALTLAGCSKKNNSDDPMQITPAKATLSSPAENSVCMSGTIVNTTQSTISFAWSSAANASSYDLTITDLLTKASTTQNFTTNQASVTLLRNTPYSWYVTSKSSSSTLTAKSDSWKFFNAGAGTVSYAPFPASITSPGFAQTVTASAGGVDLIWSGSSVATGAALVYDIYFGTIPSPVLLKSNIADSFLNNVQVTSKTTYYWKVITKDPAGNTSDSGVYQFVVK